MPSTNFMLFIYKIGYKQVAIGCRENQLHMKSSSSAVLLPCGVIITVYLLIFTMLTQYKVK